MKTRAMTIALLACSLARAAPATPPSTAPDIKPGLWEVTDNVSSPNGQVQAAMSEVRKQLATMSPEQRQAVQQMLEKNGVQLDVGGDGAIRSTMCMTRAMIERQALPMQQGDCAYQMTPLDANRMKVGFSCTRPHATGDGEMTVDSPTRYHARMTVHNADQPDQVVDMAVSARWLGADCGSVRPMPLPGTK